MATDVLVVVGGGSVVVVGVGVAAAMVVFAVVMAVSAPLPHKAEDEHKLNCR